MTATIESLRPLFSLPDDQRTFDFAAESYVRQGGQGKYLPPIIEYFANRHVASIVPAEVRQMALDVYPVHMPSTRNRHGISPCRAVLYHAHELGWRAPCRIRMFRHPRSTKHSPVDGSWLTAFLNQSDADHLFHLSAIVVFMNHTAARISEAVNLMGQHVDLSRRIATLVKTKTDVMQTAYLTDELMFRLYNLGVNEGQNVFRYTSRFSVAERMRAVCKRAGIPYRCPHSVGRYSFATNALKRHDIKTAMDAGRWKSSAIFLETYVQPAGAGRAVAEGINQRRYEYL